MSTKNLPWYFFMLMDAVAWWLLFWRNFFCFVFASLSAPFSVYAPLNLFFPSPIYPISHENLLSSCTFNSGASCSLQTNIKFSLSRAPSLLACFSRQHTKKLAKLKKQQSASNNKINKNNGSNGNCREIFTKAKPQYNSERLEHAIKTIS